MVNVPFVSEEFQRAFRNTFAGQVNSGRDLHVSDIVIPVVDFTPTTSGTSLPESLRYCVNRNSTSFAGGTNVSLTTLGVNDGFYRIQAGLSQHEGQSNLSFYLTGDTTQTIETLYLNGNSTLTGMSGTRDFIAYQKVGDTLSYSFDEFSGNGYYTFTVTPLADVNGNIINPNGYDPQ
jgi:hypothetical protein